ncbi:NnrU family protein [Devosia sp. XK-2]|uniref:NnrU family protein n=1 Tax=Devosia sp. XK-2 TaxID=3126689 RepID=UPI0030D156B7
MITFILAFAVFLALHSIPAIPGIRQRLVAILGRRLYLATYSLISIAALAWVFQAAFALDYLELWAPAAWQAWVAIASVPVALFLLVAGLISPNPLSISFRRGEEKAGAIVAVTRHPVLWGFVLWAFGHLVVNGDLRSVMLFGALGIFAVIGMVMTERRNRRRLGASWSAETKSSSVLPFAAIIRGRAALSLDRPMVIGLMVSAVVTIWLLAGGHASLFSADPLALASS